MYSNNRDPLKYIITNTLKLVITVKDKLCKVIVKTSDQFWFFISLRNKILLPDKKAAEVKFIIPMDNSKTPKSAGLRNFEMIIVTIMPARNVEPLIKNDNKLTPIFIFTSKVQSVYSK